jgi:hypothetical protein
MSTVTYLTDPVSIIAAADCEYALKSEYIYASVIGSGEDNTVYRRHA